MRGSRRAVIAWGSAAALAISPAAARGAYDAHPADGKGAATATGTSANGSPSASTLSSAFSPAHIQPGEPFTYTGLLQADVQDNSIPNCSPGPFAQTSQYPSWFFSMVRPGEDFLTESAVGQAGVAADFSNTESYEYFCPDRYRFTSGPQTVQVSGAQSLAMEPGCYQSTVFEAGVFFPQDPSGAQSFGSLDGTVGTLRVGNGPDCVTGAATSGGGVIDARNGPVVLTVPDGRGGTYTGRFAGGIFRWTQRRAAKLPGGLRITDVVLLGGRFASCAAATAARLADPPADVSRRRVVRYLKTSANGAFNVIGKYASGIERGTKWTTTDTCDSTEVRVTQGTVVVTNRRTHKKTVVREGQTFVARRAV